MFDRTKRGLVRSYLADLDSMTIVSPLKVLKEEFLANARKAFCAIPEALNRFTNYGAYIKFGQNPSNRGGSI